MGSSTQGGRMIGLAAAGIGVIVAIVIGGNALSSTSTGIVEGVIVKQWKDRSCRRRKRRRRCDTDYNSKVKLSDGKYRTIDSRNWYKHKKTGDVVIFDKRKGGWFGDTYYKPKKG